MPVFTGTDEIRASVHQEGREILTQGEDTVELEIDLPGENEDLGEHGGKAEYLYSDARKLGEPDGEPQQQKGKGADDEDSDDEERKLLPAPEIKGSAFLVSRRERYMDVHP